MGIGAGLAWGGGVLLSLGGSGYYLAAGLATGASGVLAMGGRRAAAALYAAMLAGTAFWAVLEAGLDGWALAARLAAPLVLGLWFVAPWTWRRLHGPPRMGAGRALGAAGLALLAAGALGLGLRAAGALGFGLRLLTFTPPADPLYQAGTQVLAPPPGPAAAATGADWPVWGGDAGGTRFSALTQITRHNVGALRVAWVYHFGHAPPGEPDSLEGTPLKIGDTLYACNDANDVAALDAETGREKWRFYAHADAAGPAFGHCRGVAYLRLPGAQGACAARIFTNTIDARLIALDAATGAPCSGFGVHGIVSLRAGLSAAPKGYYFVTSAPTVAGGNIVLGGWVMDGSYVGEPSGVIRAFDAATGALSWAFDMGHPERPGAPPAGEVFTPGTPNAWAPMSVDEKLGLVYAPLGGAALDYVGQMRRPFDDAYSGAVVALDIRTGRPRWKFQTVHHDLWDYDAPAQPTLVDLPTASGLRPALIEATKRGEIFVLDRATGDPLIPVTEHRAPQEGTAPGEHAAPTQPFSDSLPSFRGAPLEESAMWGLTPLDQLWCRIVFRRSRYDGPLTPPGLTRSIEYPGYLGGANWGGVSVDADRHVMIVNTSQLANTVQLLTRAEADRLGVKPIGMGGHRLPGGSGVQPHAGTPYAARVLPFLSPLQAPCQAPPWGRISAVDLASRKLLWSHPIGTARESGPLGLASHLPFRIGTPNIGGSLVTRGGLVFIGATQDDFLRALDVTTGTVLWRGRLEAGGQATPMTYISPASGRQFVVISAGGHLYLDTRRGDAITAFALP